MQALTYEITAPQRGEVRPIELSEPGPGQLMIRVKTNGLCASDVGLWLRGPDVPTVIGHEPVGEVIATGVGVDIAIGSIVGGRIVASFAEFAIADVADVVLVPEGVDPTTVMPEPVGCVAEALRRTRLPMGATVALVGCGFMGLMMIQMLRATGASHICAIDPRDDVWASVITAGADEVHAPGDLPSSYLMGIGDRGPGGFDVVIEASGSQAGLDLATRLVRPHGTLTIMGYHQGARSMDMQTWNWKSIDVVNGHVRDRDLLRTSTEAALRLEAGGRLDLGRLITHRYRFDQIDEAFRDLHSKPVGFLKAVIDFP